MAERAKDMAKEASRTISELFREAFRTYQEKKWDRFFNEMGNMRPRTIPTGYTEEDIPGLIKEVRADARAEKEKAATLALSGK